MKRNTVLFTICILIFICAKLWLRQAGNDELLFLLTPTNWGVELFTNSATSYSSQSGYYYPEIDILIEKSCSGFNFLLISFLMITYVLSKVESLKTALVTPVALLLAYVTTIVANVSRIVTYIVMIKQQLPARLDPADVWLHKAEGTLVYLSFLLITYFSLNQIITKLTRHEKSA